MYLSNGIIVSIGLGLLLVGCSNNNDRQPDATRGLTQYQATAPDFAMSLEQAMRILGSPLCCGTYRNEVRSEAVRSKQVNSATVVSMHVLQGYE